MNSKIKIYTYKDPKNLEKRDFYKDVYKHPNLCASETLKLGLTRREKNREKSRRYDYGHICSVDSLIREIYKEWMDPVTQIRQMNSLTKYINKINNKELKESFKFNKSEILNSLRFIIEMGIEIESINPKNIVIKELKLLYSNVLKNEEWNYLNNEIEIDKEYLEVCFGKILEDEKDRYSKENKQLDIDIKKIENIDFNKIVIHGLHRFTPIIFKMIDDLQSKSIDIIFIINYLEEYPEIYKTWEEVYSWSGVSIESSDELLTDRYNLGKSIGELLNGNIEEFNNKNIDFMEFNNISSFADYVSSKYKETRECNIEGELESIGNISKMKEQFYSAKMEDINNILKQYHPDQFGDKHFLAYPIGQFILSIYNMWDNDRKKLIFDSKNLKQCLSLGFFNSKKYNCLDIYNKVESYYVNLEIKEDNDIIQLEEQIKSLYEKIKKINMVEAEKGARTTLRRFSFYNLQGDELKYLYNKLNIINNIGNEIFKDTEGNIEFYKHYKRLIDTIRSNVEEDDIINQEKEILDELEIRFKELDKIEVEGSIENIKDSLHFYLKRIEDLDSEKHQASWIVRNLEHLDGGVLLEEVDSKNKAYHLCLIGDIDMNASVKELLPWPLTLKFFEDIESMKNRHISVIKSYEERSNFLRYCLFYGTFFLNSRLIISYIKNYEEEINYPYYLLNMLGVKFEKEREEHFASQMELSSKGTSSYRKVLRKPIKENKVKNFMYCEYKYFIEDVLEGDTFFSNQYTQNLYYRTLLLDQSIKTIRKKGYINKKTIQEVVKSVNKNLKNNYFSLWKESIFKDAYANVVSQIEKHKDKLLDVRSFNKDYLEIRNKFIYAKLDDENNSNLLKNLHNITNNEYSLEKSKIMKTLMYSNDLNKVNNINKCEICGLSEICLERYRYM